MSFESLLKDTAQILAFSSTNEYGNPAYGSPGTSISCRYVSEEGKRAVDIMGEDVISDGSIYFPDSIIINEKDRIQVNSVTYRILSVHLKNGYGSNHHYKISVRRV